MAKCPHCKKEIESVIELNDITTYDEMTVDDDGRINYCEEDTTDKDHVCYQCPECEAELDFENEDQVADFLMGAI